MDFAKVKDKEQAKQALIEAMKHENTEEVTEAMERLAQMIASEGDEATRQEIKNACENQDIEIMKQRGLRVLTSEEKQYYGAVLEAMKDANPRQAIANISYVIPETVIEDVFTELRTEHKLIDLIDLRTVSAKVRLIYNENGTDRAAWGKLCDEVVKEVSASLAEIDAGLYKISAFLPVCKAALELGAEWLDRYVRETLKEALANGLEYAIITGTGKDMPIGMDRDLDAAVVGGVYAQKDQIEVTDFSPRTYGNLLSLLAMNNGKGRMLDNVILLVNPADYFKKIMPATTMLTANVGYISGVLPFPTTIIQTPFVDVGDAILGLAKRYVATLVLGKEGRIDYSDHALFLEDERLYLIKAFGNGTPKDNNAFLLLDISNFVGTSALPVVDVTPPTPSDDASLAVLRLLGLTLSPAFDPDEDTYNASTTDDANIISVIPSNAGATVAITLGGVAKENGSALTWAAGSNTVAVAVTAEDGTTTETYTITVTKS